MLGSIDRSRDGFSRSVSDALKRRYKFIDDLYADSEFAAYNFNNIYRGKRLLVLGGGPTTDTAEWDPANYDHIISCNHFFLHPRLKDINVSMAAVSPEVDVNREEFVAYYNRFNTVFLINNHDVKDDKVEFFRKNPDRLTIMENRVRLKIGQGPHLLILATLFKPHSIDFAGIDGYPQDTKIGDDACHTFEKGKKASGVRHSYQVYDEHFRIIWEYLLRDAGKDVIYRNLGYGHPYNVSSKYVNVRIPNE